MNSRDVRAIEDDGAGRVHDTPASKPGHQRASKEKPGIPKDEGPGRPRHPRPMQMRMWCQITRTRAPPSPRSPSREVPGPTWRASAPCPRSGRPRERRGSPAGEPSHPICLTKPLGVPTLEPPQGSGRKDSVTGFAAFGLPGFAARHGMGLPTLDSHRKDRLPPDVEPSHSGTASNGVGATANGASPRARRTGTSCAARHATGARLPSPTWRPPRSR